MDEIERTIYDPCSGCGGVPVAVHENEVAEF
jgi:tRNA1(Val) A37 N6-methylase TrmN6